MIPYLGVDCAIAMVDHSRPTLERCAPMNKRQNSRVYLIVGGIAAAYLVVVYLGYHAWCGSTLQYWAAKFPQPKTLAQPRVGGVNQEVNGKRVHVSAMF